MGPTDGGEGQASQSQGLEVTGSEEPWGDNSEKHSKGAVQQK